MHTIPFSEARAHLAEALSSLDQGGEPVLISRRGEAAAVLMSVAQYQRLVAQGDGPAARLQAWRAEHADLFAAEPESDDPWAEVRDRRPTRSVDWAEAGAQAPKRRR
nr:type II toxin-antitoxin system Phd/YefM family antitoxin [Variovorax boronicumulans]